jgi:hypothetical protein
MAIDLFKGVKKDQNFDEIESMEFDEVVFLSKKLYYLELLNTTKPKTQDIRSSSVEKLFN